MQLHDVLRLSSGAAALLIVAFLALAGRRRDAGWSSVVLSSVQIALTTLLVVCAGLLARSAIQLRSIDPGLSGDGSSRAVIALGLSISSVATNLLTGYLFGVSVTDLAAFVMSSVLVAGVAVSAWRLKSRPARPVV